MRRERNPEVAEWFAEHADDEVYLTAPTVAELVFGIMRLPDGRRKSELDDGLMLVLRGFRDRMIDFDFSAALEFGRFVPDRIASGRPIEVFDGQIAACCIANGATLATRNTKHFEAIPGLDVVNPWEHLS